MRSCPPALLHSCAPALLRSFAPALLRHDPCRKDGPLHDRLKTVYVESTDPEDSVPEQGKREQPGRPFPRDTAQYSYDFVPAQLRMDTWDRAARQLPRGKVC